MAILILLIALSFVLFFYNKPDILFWISLCFYFDPGGILLSFFERNLFGLNPPDIFFVIILYAALSKFGTLVPRISLYKEFRTFFRSFLGFFFISFILIYGFISPYIHGYFNPVYFLIKNRTAFYAVFLLYLTFQFLISDTKNLYLKIIIWPSMVILPLFFLSVVSGFQIIPVYTMDRYTDSGMMRIGMSSYGLMYFTIPLFTTLIFLGWVKNSSNSISKNQIYFTGILMSLVLLVTLTRRDIISLITGFFFSWVIVNWQRNKILKISHLFKIFIPFVLVLIMLVVLFPQYIGWLDFLFKDTTSLLVTGHDTFGNTDYRLEGGGGLIEAKSYILDNPLFGMGYYPYSFQDVVAFAGAGNRVATAMNDSAEVPIYGTFLRMGLIGVLLILRLYYYQISFALKNIKLFRKHFDFVHNNVFFYHLIFLMIINLWALKFTIEYLNLMKEFTSGMVLSDFCIISGVFFASIYKIRQKITENISPQYPE